MARKVNDAAFAIAVAAEGCVLTTYRDPAGTLTAGYGHTGPDVVPGTTYVQAQADTWLASDMARAAACVEAHVRVPLNDDQFSALAEFVFNIGAGAFAASTLLRLLNQGYYAAVPLQLMRWTRAGGRVQPGLTARRAREAALFATLAADSPASPCPRPAPPTLLECLRRRARTA